MKFQIRNLGNIRKANIELKDLTIICGPNSSNKTWLSYAIFHHLSFLKLSGFVSQVHPDLIKQYEKKTSFKIDIKKDNFINMLRSYMASIERVSSENINTTFSTTSDYFKDFDIKLVEGIDQNENERINSKRAQELIDCLEREKIEHSYPFMLVTSDEMSSTIRFLVKDEFAHLVQKATNTATFLGEFIFDCIQKYSFHSRPFAITSERVGCLMFQKDIDGTALKLQDTLNKYYERSSYKNNLDTSQLVSELHSVTLGNRSNVAIPIRRNLEAVRNAQEEFKKNSFIKEKHHEVIKALRQMTKGTFSSDNGVVQYKQDDGKVIPTNIASSSIKSLYHLDLYINNLAKPDDVLLIDEPELNLHPDNQRLIASVIARIANSGIKVLITTHSDYLVREINNSIMLSHEFDEKKAIMEQYDLIDEDILTQDQVQAYSVDIDGNVNAMNMLDTGIDSAVFDNIIHDANYLQEALFSALEIE